MKNGKLCCINLWRQLEISGRLTRGVEYLYDFVVVCDRRVVVLVDFVVVVANTTLVRFVEVVGLAVVTRVTRVRFVVEASGRSAGIVISSRLPSKRSNPMELGKEN